MAKSEQLNELALALSKVQGEIDGAIKDAINPHFKSSYADLTSCWQACREYLAKYSIAVVQSSDDTDTHLCLTTTLIHSSGQWIDGTLKIERKVNDRDKSRRDMNAQEIGSAITYFRRYSLCSMVGICPEDDDANSISDGKNKQEDYLPPPIKNMSASQVTEVELILKDCSPTFQQHIAYELKEKFKVISMHQIEEANYPVIKRMALQDKEEFQKKKLEALADLSKNGVK